jgi:rod shape-determining protein MreC
VRRGGGETATPVINAADGVFNSFGGPLALFFVVPYMFELLKKYRTVLLASCLILAALLLYSSQLRNRQQTALFYKVILQITAPLQKILDSSVATVADVWDRYLWLVETDDQNRQLLAENRQLKADLAQLDEVRLANERLRKLLDFKQDVAIPVLPAQVVGEDASSWFRTVVIDKGSHDGLREGLPVVVSEGVVGRTLQVSPYQSRVLLITDASSAVAVLVQSSRSRGICRGEGEELILNYALRGDAVQAGDPIVTSGTGGIFPKGLPVGKVSSAYQGPYGLFQTIKVAPAVDFSRLEEVLVLMRDEP